MVKSYLDYRIGLVYNRQDKFKRYLITDKGGKDTC